MLHTQFFMRHLPTCTILFQRIWAWGFSVLYARALVLIIWAFQGENWSFWFPGNAVHCPDNTVWGRIL